MKEGINSMKISFITDEATQSFDEAIQFAKLHHLQGLELRSVDDTAIDNISEAILKSWKLKLEESQLSVPCIAGSFYKCDISEANVDLEIEKLKRLCRAADILDCKLIRGFTFMCPESGNMDPEDLVPYYSKAAEILKEYNKTLLLEADPCVNLTNHASLAALLKELDPLYFGAIFDPGNDLYDPFHERPFPDGYNAIKPYARHIHIKDAVREGKEISCVKIGTGQVGYLPLLQQLIRDGYNGWLSMETHYRKDITLTEEQLHHPQGASFTKGGMGATAECIQALQSLLDNAESKAVL